jgi:hypothetical protein
MLVQLVSRHSDSLLGDCAQGTVYRTTVVSFVQKRKESHQGVVDCAKGYIDEVLEQQKVGIFLGIDRMSTLITILACLGRYRAD